MRSMKQTKNNYAVWLAAKNRYEAQMRALEILADFYKDELELIKDTDKYT